MRLKDRRALGEKVASLVLEAEAKFPGRGRGPEKRRWVERQGRKEAPKGNGPSAQFAKWFGAFLLRVAIEVAVASLNKVTDHLLAP